MKKLMIMAVAAMATAFAAVAGTATSFAYQGVLRDELGKPLSQTQATITFKLYNVATGGNTLWSKTMSLALDTNGLFNAELSGGGLADVIAESEASSLPLYIGLTVDGSSGEITPRQKMIPTPLAAYAQNVAKADGDFTVGGEAIFNGAVSMKGNETNAVFNATKVNVSGGLTVTKGAVLNGGVQLGGEVKVASSLTVDGVYMSMPVGAIIMWAGTATDLPTDGCWAICDGQTTYTFKGEERTVPDLSGRFIVGAGTCTDKDGNKETYEVGSTGGVYKVKLSVNEMPSHAHRFSRGRSTSVTEIMGGYHVFASEEVGNYYDTEAAGGDQAHENRPPYYALCYIIKIK